MKPIRVVIVDDSALMRGMLTEMLFGAPGIEVAGTAGDPYEAREVIKRCAPDVVTLDIEMPRMDGLAFLEKIMRLRPLPVIMVSSLTQKGADATVRALELGAVDCIAKEASHRLGNLEEKREELIAKVRAAATARVMARTVPATPTRLRFDAKSATRSLVAIGASTGGVEALRALLTVLPASLPPLVITQHMPEQFTASFARRLDGLCALRVREAADGMAALPGHAYIAPGGQHLEVRGVAGGYALQVVPGPLVSGHRPSVDVLFASVAASVGADAVGLILTGMGSDGTQGLSAMREAGALTLGQDEASCVVYGMPRAARLAGAVMAEWPLSRIPQALLDACRN
jgi:two-component system chemotaxis response regulator CheB